ncbi:MAG: hypothetical protein ACI9LM_003490 [Alteromonadaceae bacterium]|jgi:hypothetical protein
MNSVQLHFSKQFFITSKELTINNFFAWHQSHLSNEQSLYCHPELIITEEHNDSTQLVILGVIIDPETPEHTTRDILHSILSKTDTFAEIEKYLYGLGGRWVLIIVKNNDCRIYHDAAGLKPVFYKKIDVNTHIIASQPALIEALGYSVRDSELYSQFHRYPNSQSWPLGVVPFSGVTQLLPNHYLDVDNMAAIRYWPTPSSGLSYQGIDAVAEQISDLLKGSIKALTLRNECKMSITGGYDSRMLYSTAKEHLKKISFFTVKSSFTPLYDIDIPQRIVSKYKLPHKFSQIKKQGQYSSDIITILSNNVGNMYYDRSMVNISIFADLLENCTHLPGSVSEIGRCFYFPYGKRYSKLNGRSLARYCGFKGNPEAIKSFDNWLTTMPKNMPHDILDMAYWEHRLGIWGSCGLTYREGLIEQIPPMNNRRFMELCLSVPIKDRIDPHNLIRKIIEINDPELLDIPFNDDTRPINTLFNKYPLLKRIRHRIFK